MESLSFLQILSTFFKIHSDSGCLLKMKDITEFYRHFKLHSTFRGLQPL